MKKNNLVSIIIVNWNGFGYLKECLFSLSKQTYKNIEIIFVDNASIDDSVKFVKKNFPKVKIIKTKKNLGFAGGNNIGYKYAKGDYVLFLNNDTRTASNAIAELVKNMDDKPDIGGAQGKILLMDNPKNLDSVGAFLTHTGILYHYGANKRDSAKYNKQIYLYSAKGAFMIFRKNVLDKVLVNGNPLDADYFAYFEETDMCHRVWLSGYKIIYIPSAVMYHKLGGTSTKLNNAFVQYHSFKNRINAYLKNLSIPSLLIILPVHLVICEGFGLLAILQRNLNLFFAIQRSMYWNIVNIETTLRKRHDVQTRIRKITDSKLFFYVMHNVGLNYYLDMPNALKNYVDKPIAKIYEQNK